jgi:hypothetical protein
LRADDVLRAEWEGFRKAMRSLSALPAEVPPAGFARQVERRIRQRSRGRFFADRRPARLPFEWFSFVLIVALLVLYLLTLAELPKVSPMPDRGPRRPAAPAPAAPRP